MPAKQEKRHADPAVTRREGERTPPLMYGDKYGRSSVPADSPKRAKVASAGSGGGGKNPPNPNKKTGADDYPKYSNKGQGYKDTLDSKPPKGDNAPYYPSKPYKGPDGPTNPSSSIPRVPKGPKGSSPTYIPVEPKRDPMSLDQMTDHMVGSSPMGFSPHPRILSPRSGLFHQSKWPLGQ